VSSLDLRGHSMKRQKPLQDLTNSPSSRARNFRANNDTHGSRERSISVFDQLPALPFTTPSKKTRASKTAKKQLYILVANQEQQLERLKQALAQSNGRKKQLTRKLRRLGDREKELKGFREANTHIAKENDTFRRENEHKRETLNKLESELDANISKVWRQHITNEFSSEWYKQLEDKEKTLQHVSSNEVL